MIHFSEQLRMIRSGDLDAELTEKMADCVKAVDEQGGTATLTLKITVKRSGNNSGYFKVSATASTKLPKAEPIESILYGTQDGALWEDNPKQTRLFDQPAAIAGAELRESVEKVGGKIAHVEVVDKRTGEVIPLDAKKMN